MRTSTKNLKSILTGSFSMRLIVDSFYGLTRTKMDLGASGWELKWDSEADIKAAGTLTIVYNDDLAASISPTEFTAALAPFGQELNLILEVSASAAFTETVQLGRYRITAVPDARDEYFNILGRTVTLGSTVKVTLEDRLVGIKRWGFRSDESPTVGLQCWAEMQRISGMQILKSLPDQPVPAGLIYTATRGGRLDAVQTLARVLGGRAYVTPDGALSVLSDVWGAASTTLKLGEDGTILDVGQAMESDDVWNEIVGNFETTDRTPIFAVASINVGPLAISGPYGVNTKYVTNPTVTTQVQANAYVAKELIRSSSLRIYRVPVQCVVNPLIEDGDVVDVQRPNGAVLQGRVANHQFGGNGMMNLELDTIRNV